MTVRSLIGDRAFYRRVFRIMTPILIQNVITNFVGLLDNLMVGQIGTEPMSGVAIVNQLLFVYNLCLFGALAGPGIFTAQFFGRGDPEGVRSTFRAKIIIAMLIFAAFSAVFVFSGTALIGQFLHEGQERLDLAATLGHGQDYLRIMILQMFPFAWVQVYAGTLRETGETVVPMRASVTAMLVNLVLNYILIFGKLGLPALGVTGAAIATLIARLVECGIVVVWTHRHHGRCAFIDGAYRSMKVPGELLRPMLRMGLPLLLNELLWSSGMTTLNQCYSLRGLEVVSALNISTTASSLFFCAFLSMGSTVAIMIGQLLGAGEPERAVDEDRKLTAFSVALCTLVGVVMALIAPLLPELYNTGAPIKALAVRLLLVSAAMMPVNAYTNCCYFTLRCGGKTLITFLFDCAFVWVVSIPTAFILSRFTALPILPMVIAVNALDLIKCVIGYVLVRSRRWVNKLVG
ncbi:MAG: MATE family efflux transporter [Oscillospiraceae bacterium]|nr:MATE family efflux transporter [Oscillospiraceae bacterium]